MQYKLKELVNHIVDNRGKNPPYYTQAGIPVIDNYLINNSYYPNLKNVSRFIDENLFNNFIRCKSQKDDILITLVGNGLGNCCLCPNNTVIIQNTIGLRLNGALCLQKYIFYQLTTKAEQIKQLNRGASQPSAKVSDLLDIKLSVPNLDEQRHIVDTIQTLFAIYLLLYLQVLCSRP